MRLLTLFLIGACAVFGNVDFYGDFSELGEKLKNDKEVYSRSLSVAELEAAKSLYPPNEGHRFMSVLVSSMENVSSEGRICDLSVAAKFRNRLGEEGIDPASVLKHLRSRDFIDDILFDLMNRSLLLEREITGALSGEVFVGYPRYYFRTPAILAGNNVEELFRELENWPDGKERCLLDALEKFVRKINHGQRGPGPGDMSYLNDQALRQSLINEEQFKVLQILGRNTAWKRKISLASYLDKIQRAKNVMSYTPQTGLESAKEYWNRRPKVALRLADRRKLYQKYTATQIVMLAQVLEKASMRMGGDPSVDTGPSEIVTDYVIRRDGQTREVTERYVLSPSEQFSYARKRLRLDLMEVVSSNSFKNKGVSYEDIVAAGLETGYISHADLGHVLAYDDLWNPNVSAWTKYKSFFWSLADTATLYLPSPLNVVGAVGLTVLNIYRSNRDYGHEEHENPANLFD